MNEELKDEFYSALMRYKNTKEKSDLRTMWRIWSVATHEDHQTAKEMIAAVRWAGFDFYAELARCGV